MGFKELDLLDLCLFTLVQSIGHWQSLSIWICSVPSEQVCANCVPPCTSPPPLIFVRCSLVYRASFFLGDSTLMPVVCFRSLCPIQVHFLLRICRGGGSWLVCCQISWLLMQFGHQILRIQRRHLVQRAAVPNPANQLSDLDAFNSRKKKELVWKINSTRNCLDVRLAYLRLDYFGLCFIIQLFCFEICCLFARRSPPTVNKTKEQRPARHTEKVVHEIPLATKRPGSPWSAQGVYYNQIYGIKIMLWVLEG